MKYLPFILIILIAGCVTQKRCFEKFPPDTTTITEYIPGEIEYGDTTFTVEILGDTAYVESPWSDNSTWDDFDERITPQDATLKYNIAPIRADVPLAYSTAWVENNILKMQLIQKDSIMQFKIDSAFRSGVDVLKIIETKIVEKVVAPKRFGFFKNGFWFSVILNLILAGLLVLFFKMK